MLTWIFHTVKKEVQHRNAMALSFPATRTLVEFQESHCYVYLILCQWLLQGGFADVAKSCSSAHYRSSWWCVAIQIVVCRQSFMAPLSACKFFLSKLMLSTESRMMDLGGH